MLDAMHDDDLQIFDMIAQRAAAVREQLARVIVGQDEIIELLLVSLLAGGHSLVIGVPGLAKTLMIRCLAQCLGWRFRRIQFTPDMVPGDVIGSELIQQDSDTGRRELRFSPGPIFANLVLADEINRTPPRTQAALLEAMAERQVTVSGRTMPLEQPFVVVATQNPIEQEGTYPLPEAQLDRFMLSLSLDYPDAAEERRIMADRPPDAPLERQADVQAVFHTEEALRIAALIRRMPVADVVVDEALRLVRRSRPDDPTSDDHVRQYVMWGAGPRAGQYLLLAARALAALRGAPTPDRTHLHAVAPAVLAHRMVLSYAALGDRMQPVHIVQHLLDRSASKE
jgi:MoxR-like ATPase